MSADSLFSEELRELALALQDSQQAWEATARAREWAERASDRVGAAMRALRRVQEEELGRILTADGIDDSDIDGLLDRLTGGRG